MKIHQDIRGLLFILLFITPPIRFFTGFFEHLLSSFLNDSSVAITAGYANANAPFDDFPAAIRRCAGMRRDPSVKTLKQTKAKAA